MGTRGQILAAIAIVTTPTVVYTVLAAVTFWAARRRLHNLAWAMGASIPLGWGGAQLVKALVRRPRPDTAAPLITAEGWAYPSSHMVAITVLAIARRQLPPNANCAEPEPQGRLNLVRDAGESAPDLEAAVSSSFAALIEMAAKVSLFGGVSLP